MSCKAKVVSDLVADLDAVIGRGLYGTVYASKSAVDEVVKEIELDGIASNTIEAIETELCAMQFFKHPNLLEYKQVVRDNETFYLRMRRYKSSLEQVIKSFKRRRIAIPEAKALEIVRQISSALAYLHAPGGKDLNGDNLSPIIVRYLHPSQVLIDDDDAHYVLSDFGIPKDKFSSRTSFEIASAYIAPESRGTGLYTTASDMWSVGCILYELMTMNAPTFTRNTKNERTFPENWEPDLSKVEGTIGRELVKRLLVVDPTSRLSAAQLATLLGSDIKQESALTVLRLESLEALCTSYSKELDALREQCRQQETEMNELRARLVALEQCQSTYSTVHTITEQGAPVKREGTSSVATKELNGEQKELSKAATAHQGLGNLLPFNQLTELVDENYPYVIEEGALDALCGGGTTSLMRAAQEGNIEEARRLLPWEKGLQNENGWTALMVAVMQGHTGVALLLAEHEKGFNDGTGKTALMWAARHGNREVARVLVPREKGMQDILGQTALMYAAQNGHADIARLLAPHEQRMRDSNEETALLKAVHWGHAGVVQILAPLERDLRGRRGRTALDHARAEGRQAIVALLS